jgi:peroxiredoxin
MTPIELSEAPVRPAPLPIGARGPAFEGLAATDGGRFGFSDFAADELVVLIFSSNRCPTAKEYGSRMNAFQRDFGPHGVRLVAINSNDPHLYPDEDKARMVERATADGYTFPYLVDHDQHVAAAYGATCTFHVFVLDRDRRIRYQGRFDDSRIEANVSHNDLRDAVDDLLAGRDVRVATTRPFGCSLDYV